MKEEMLDQLIGQTAANATLLHAITTVLVQKWPAAQPALVEAAEASALVQKQGLTDRQREAYNEYFSDLRALWT